MKVLFIVPCFPVPAHSGATIAALDTLRSLHALCELHLLAPQPDAAGSANQVLLHQLLPGISVHFYQARDAQPARLEMYATAAQAAIRGKTYWERTWFNRDLRAAVQRLMTQHNYDVMHCDWLQPAISLGGLDIPLVLRTLDVHFIGMLDYAESLPPGDKLRRAYWHQQAQRFRRFECATLSAASAVVTLGPEDDAVLRGEGVSNLVTIPPPREVEPAPEPSEPGDICNALFMGRLDMPVNREAFFLFADKVWPQVRDETRARLKVVFAGGFPDEKVCRRAAEVGIEIRAPLSDAEAEQLFAEAEIFLSPVRSGTGIKIKTLEAMARGKPMIGFPGAFRGVPVENGKQALIAETPEEFAQQFELLVSDPTCRRKIGETAREFIKLNYDPAILGPRLMDLYTQVAESYAQRAMQEGA